MDAKTGLPIELSHILEDVRNLKSKQTSLNDKLSYMQTENQALWGEIGTLRQKHAKQQMTVTKLIEFLVGLLHQNSKSAHEQSVEQQLKEGLTAELSHGGYQQTQYHSSNESALSPNTLKRKHAAITHNNDESNKRTTAQQQQQQQFAYPTAGLGRQQSVTINEVTDNDAGAWVHANTSPLVDLVPSPPPVQSTDDNHLQQKQNNDYRWTTTSNQQAHPPSHDQKHVRQQDVANPYVPDFVLRSDNPNLGQTDAGKPLGVQTVISITHLIISIFNISVCRQSIKTSTCGERRASSIDKSDG